MIGVAPDPKMLKIQLGIELRRLREESERTAAEAAAVVGGTAPKISKIESGKQGVTTAEVEKLAELYKAPAKRRKYLIGLASQLPKRSPRRTTYRDAVPDWFQRFHALEYAATDMRIYEVEIVTGLLQTEAYARSTIEAWEPAADPRLIERQVQTRMDRQEVLTRRQKPLNLQVVLSEAALRRVQGNSDIMREQLDSLIEASHRPNVELRVLPFAVPNRIAVASAVFLLRLKEQQLSAVYLEDVLGASYLDDPEEFTRYNVVFERLRSASLPEEESREFTAKVAGSYG
ncbi:helix-turn-helix transcriptional regulator [Saccharopolyspora sp. SCSIO 74807]|uniref:helix-turn-helix domain-containing protein n=1 Tax=Saccharopolyspora sp. SCSIO 74807 TaxID=3118084 RepID=UPI0030CD210F